MEIDRCIGGAQEKYGRHKMATFEVLFNDCGEGAIWHPFIISTYVEESQLFCGFQSFCDFFFELVIRNGFVEGFEVGLGAMNANGSDGIFARH